MASDFQAVRGRFSIIRFPADDSSQVHTLPSTDVLASATSHFRLENLPITSRLTPSLAEIVRKSLAKLRIRSDYVNAFVYSSPEIQAQCLPSSGDNCVLRLSSGIISLMSANELRFVIGHELAHHIYQHSSSALSAKVVPVEDLMKIRYQEISADRIGLLNCASIRTAVSALLKTASGLGNRHIRIDVPEYLAQLKESIDSNSMGVSQSSHPPLLIRCRALLWFSGAVSSVSHLASLKAIELERLNTRIQNDLDAFLDAPVVEYRTHLTEMYSLWHAVSLIIDSGRFSKEDQKLIADIFGVNRLEQVKRFLGATPKSELAEIVSKKEVSTLNSIKESFPHSWNALAESARERVAALYGTSLHGKEAQ